MLKRSIGIGIMCLASHAYSANIAVTTTEDVTKNDSECSLREAVAYINADMPKAGLNGCGGADTSAVIELKSEKTYNLNTRINITKSTQIKTVYLNSIETQLGLKNATIKMQGTDLIFNIFDNSIVDNPIAVSFSEITLDGCAKTSGCNNNGGLIYNQERLTAQYMRFKNGVASVNGGAIYNAGTVTNDDNTSGYVTIINSIFEKNSAQQGAAIYSELPRFNVYKTVVRDNINTNETNGTVFYSQTNFTDSSTTGNLSQRIYGLKNSSIFSNTGYVINVRDGMVVNNLTVLQNSKGIYLDAPLGNASLSNSILLENGRYNPNGTSSEGNCTFATTDLTKVQNNLSNEITAQDCGLGTTANPNNSVGTDHVLAGSSIEGRCDLPPAMGLLCPFHTPENTFLGYFKPRLLLSYTAITDSPIVNRGRVFSNGDTLSLASCENEDQRKKTRTSLQLCDLGSIELVVDQTTLDKVGSEIVYGETAKFSLVDNMADGELVPASACFQILGSGTATTDSNGKVWQSGCLQVVQTNTVSKGKLTISADGDLTYVPNGNWHGTDEFNIRVITTLTRFNNLSNKYLEIPVKIVQDPPNTFQDKTVSTGSGSIGWLGLMALLGLIGLRRIQA